MAEYIGDDKPTFFDTKYAVDSKYPEDNLHQIITTAGKESACLASDKLLNKSQMARLLRTPTISIAVSTTVKSN